MQLKILSIISFLIFSFSFSQENKAEIKFDQKIIDYGVIEYDSDGKRTFKFTNVGEAPLIFNRISSSCGCTVPKRPEKPVEPGKFGEIEVEYDTKRVGVFIKAITINSNAINSNIVLRIKGEVLEEEEEEEEEEL
ncbi:MAG: hypothetical protein CND00_01235 [Cryomorphaceae bacterium MED-G14]|nr:MAG: hypothetical protein CND00_01235 [Cryomorphaceae bacterium MED-G14]|tara:strand:- start:2923 stop:3327 length:405 start_codon:yes stop_codon:yes gene_type:complete